MPTGASALIAGRLTARFRAGMRPLAAGTAMLVTLSAPVAYFLLKRHDLHRQAAIYARQIAALIRETAEERGELWRYDSPKLVQALRFAQGRQGESDICRIEIDDLGGRSILPDEALWPERPGPAVTGEATLTVNGETAGRVRVWVTDAQAFRGAALLAGIFGALGGALGLALYLFPLQLLRQEDLVRLLVGRSLRATEEERLRLSRELHDGVGQAIGAAAVAIARARARPGDPAPLAESARLLDDALDELRRVALALRPPALDDLGLGPAVAAFAKATAEVAGLALVLDLADVPRLAPEIEQACYRLVQEAVSNVVRHARAQSLHLGLGCTKDELRIRVEDDGQGFSPGEPLGLGLLGARERVARLSGTLDLESAPGRGTRLRIALPLGQTTPAGAKA